MQLTLGNNKKIISPSLPIRSGNTPRQGVSRHLRMLLLNATTSWNFDPFELDLASNGHPLSNLFIWLVDEANLVDRLGLDVAKLRAFALEIEAGYNLNPYHNRIHVCAVLQRVHIMLLEGGLGLYLKDTSGLYILAAYLAAVCHDFRHLGLTNDFLVKSSDNLATIYNDQAPNENYHLTQSFYVLKTEQCNILSALPDAARQFVRNLMIDLVLATDMSQHFNIVTSFQSKATSLHANENSLSSASEVPAEDKLLALKIALKSADLSHTAAPWTEHSRWVKLLQDELWTQGDREKSLGLKPSALTDRQKQGMISSQLGFFDIFVLPMYQSLVTAFPACSYLLDGARQNFSRWKSDRGTL